MIYVLSGLRCVLIDVFQSRGLGIVILSLVFVTQELCRKSQSRSCWHKPINNKWLWIIIRIIGSRYSAKMTSGARKWVRWLCGKRFFMAYQQKP
jgi:hypothetical protein